MDATKPSHLLEDQHHRIDAGVQGVAEGGGSITALAESLTLLRLHLYVEETVLFPPLAKGGLTMPIFVMQREHGQMWPLLESLIGACAASAPAATLHEPCRQLFQLLRMHNPKEEQVLYAAADRQAGAATLAGALAAATLPDGWRCKLAPH